MHQRTPTPQTAPTYRAHVLDREAVAAARASNAAAALAARHQLEGDPVAAEGARALARWHRGRMRDAAQRAQAARLADTVAAIAGAALERPTLTA